MIVIKSGRHPFEVMILAVCVLSGVYNTINYTRAASSVLRELPTAFGYVFYIGMAMGAAITLAGVFWRTITGPLIERAGLWMLAGLWLSFSVLLAAVGPRGVYFAAFVGGFAGAAIWRGLQIGRELKHVHAAATLTGSTEHVEDG